MERGEEKKGTEETAELEEKGESHVGHTELRFNYPRS